MTPARRRKNPQAGFAMLFVFVMAAAVSIMLFMEIPRVAFERQRDKEQLLIDRGEQYKRAIQLYYRKNKKYPASLDDLETTSNIRYLRRRYADPITGKNEWRLIHSTNGVFTDSLTKAPPGEDVNKKTAEPNTFTWNAPGIGAAGAEQGGQTALYNRQRPSDSANHIPGGTSPFPGAQGQTPQVGPDGQPIVNPNAPPQQPGQPGFNPAMPGFPQQQQPGQPGFPQQQQPGFPQQPAFPQQQQPGFPQQQPGFPQQQQPGFPQQQQPGGFSVQQPPGYGVPVQAPGQIQSGGQTVPFGQPFGQVQPGQQAGQPGVQPGATGQPGQNAAAASMIWNQLTTPRQPPAGLFNNAAQGQSMGTGIAGVASMAEMTGIKIYKEREKYNEWEFLYDLAEDAGARGMAGQGNQQGQGIPGTPGFGGGQSGFGANPGFGGGQRIGGPGNGQIPFPGTGPGGVQIGPGGLPVGGPGQVIIQPGQPGGAPIRRAR